MWQRVLGQGVVNELVGFGAQLGWSQELGLAGLGPSLADLGPSLADLGSSV